MTTKKQNDSLWAGLYRAGWCSLMVFVIVAAIGAFVPKARQLSALKSQLAGMDQRVEKRDRSIRDIQDRRDRFAKDPAFVERTARQSGFFRPGEVIVEYIAH